MLIHGKDAGLVRAARGLPAFRPISPDGISTRAILKDVAITEMANVYRVKVKLADIGSIDGAAQFVSPGAILATVTGDGRRGRMPRDFPPSRKAFSPSKAFVAVVAVDAAVRRVHQRNFKHAISTNGLRTRKFPISIRCDQKPPDT